MKFIFGDHVHHFDRPWVMGIVNVTPDSFSDGGLCETTEAAIAHALRLVEEGADVLDIGGESTRPGSLPVDTQEEIDRVVPVIEALRNKVKIPISIDTSKAAVAEAACEAGAGIINDVTALEGDPRMGEVVARYQAGLCLMHMKGTPKTMQDEVTYTDAVNEIEQYLGTAIQRALAHGISPDSMLVDPGIGFGKHLNHNLQLIQACGSIAKRLNRPILMGVSRKSFLGTLTGRSVHEREAGTAAAVTACVLAGAHIVRVHHVAAARDVVAVAQALRTTRETTGEWNG